MEAAAQKDTAADKEALAEEETIKHNGEVEDEEQEGSKVGGGRLPDIN